MAKMSPNDPVPQPTPPPRDAKYLEISRWFDSNRPNMTTKEYNYLMNVWQQKGTDPREYLKLYKFNTGTGEFEYRQDTPVGRSKTWEGNLNREFGSGGYLANNPTVRELLKKDYQTYDEFKKALEKADPYYSVFKKMVSEGKDASKINELISKGTSATTLENDYTMLYGTPIDRIKMAISQAGSAKAPEFNDTKNKEVLDAFIASLEDPYNQATQSMIGGLNTRGMYGSGYQQEALGRLMTAFQNAKSQEANALTGDTANQQINAANLNYNQQTQAYLSELETLWKNSGEDWDTFYNKNRALIDSKLSGYASDKGIAYQQVQSDYQTGIQNFQDVINSTSDLFGSIGGLGADLYSSATKTNAPLTERINTPVSSTGTGYNPTGNFIQPTGNSFNSGSTRWG